MIRSWILTRVLRSFRTVSRLSLWFEMRFTALGRLLCTGAGAAAIFGIDPNQTVALQLAALLFAAVTVAMLTSIRWRPRLEIQRVVPDTVTVDVQTTYVVTIVNHGAHAEVGLILADCLATQYPNADEFRRTSRTHSEGRTNWFDQYVGFPRWLLMVRKSRGARLEPISIPIIPARGSVNVTAPLRAIRRGKLVFTNVELRRPDPLGLFFARHKIEQYAELVSLPKRYPIPPLSWVSERHFHRGGLALATTVGDSEEFIGLREYRPGDPLRHIHWRSFAKRGQPVVKVHQDEYFDRHALVIDTFLGHCAPSDFEAVISIAASFIQSERPSDSILDLVFIEQNVWRLTTGRGLSNNRQILLQLAQLEATQTDKFSDITSYMERYLDRLASVIMVGTTWGLTRQEFVNELRHRQLRCLALITPDDPDLVTYPATGLGQPNTVRPTHIAEDIGVITQALVGHAT
jgi:uncharacterized protein (DUF58 family)